MPEQGLVPGEERAQGEVSLPGHEVGGGLAHHAALKQGRHLHGEGGAQGARAVPPHPLRSGH